MKDKQYKQCSLKLSLKLKFYLKFSLYFLGPEPLQRDHMGRKFLHWQSGRHEWAEDSDVLCNLALPPGLLSASGWIGAS